IGILSAANALMHVRTSQGTIAWCIALVTFPWIAVPFYWILGRNKFHGYLETLRTAIVENVDLVAEAREAMSAHHGKFTKLDDPAEYTLDSLTLRRFTSGNKVELLIDGTATFDAIFKAIDGAKNYLLIQFFIIKDDELGGKMKSRLIARARDGIRIHVLFDEIGTHALSREYIEDLRNEGIEVSGFGTTRGPANRFQLNFRNHRKIVIADGEVAFVGGHNVGDAYLGKSKKFGHWRDTHVRIEGPAVLGVQAVFVEDWFWATRVVPQLNWSPRRVRGKNVNILPLETGPADTLETCTLMFLHLINSARERLWIASPYFVPDESIASALQLAALRGVDVRIMIPDQPDHKMVYLAAFSYLEKMGATGVKIFRYVGGFLHQKVALVDHHLSVVGTANLDNRSFRLNFELSIAVSNREFALKVEKMLADDFTQCRQVDGRDYTERPAHFRFAVRVCRLLAPIL
ncbi:MAG: cardiolipin synthase, partial [Verrucomicrobiales bacterium]